MICNRCHQQVESKSDTPTRCNYCGSEDLRHAGMGEYGVLSRPAKTEANLPDILFVGFSILLLIALCYFLPILESSIRAWITWGIGSLVYALVIVTTSFISFFGNGLHDILDDIGNYLGMIAASIFVLMMLKGLIVCGLFAYHYVTS